MKRARIHGHNRHRSDAIGTDTDNDAGTDAITVDGIDNGDNRESGGISGPDVSTNRDVIEPSGNADNDIDGSDANSGSGAVDRSAASGTDANRDGIDGDGSDPRPPRYGAPITSAGGRHKRRVCPCEKCSVWRASQGADFRVAGTPEPETVEYRSLGKSKREFGKNLTKETLALALQGLYHLPSLMLPADTAGHWPLQSAEEDALSDRLVDVVNMIPKRNRTRAMEALGKIVPPVMLAVTAYLITKPRIDETRRLIAERKRVGIPRQSETSHATTATGPRPGPGFVAHDSPAATVSHEHAATASAGLTRAAVAHDIESPTAVALDYAESSSVSI